MLMGITERKREMKTGKILGRIGMSASLFGIGASVSPISMFGFVREFNILLLVSMALLIVSHVVLLQVRR